MLCINTISSHQTKGCMVSKPHRKKLMLPSTTHNWNSEMLCKYFNMEFVLFHTNVIPIWLLRTFFRKASFPLFKEIWITFLRNNLIIDNPVICANELVPFQKFQKPHTSHTCQNVCSREQALINRIIVFWWGNKGTRCGLPPVMETGPLSTLNPLNYVHRK